MDRLTAVEQAFTRLELPTDLSADALRREAKGALLLAEQGISRDHMKAHIAQMLLHRMGTPFNPADCEQVAATVLEIAHAPGP